LNCKKKKKISPTGFKLALWLFLYLVRAVGDWIKKPERNCLTNPGPIWVWGKGNCNPYVCYLARRLRGKSRVTKTRVPTRWIDRWFHRACSRGGAQSIFSGYNGSGIKELLRWCPIGEKCQICPDHNEKIKTEKKVPSVHHFFLNKMICMKMHTQLCIIQQSSAKSWKGPVLEDWLAARYLCFEDGTVFNIFSFRGISGQKFLSSRKAVVC
jgi:hypothetical protein